MPDTNKLPISLSAAGRAIDHSIHVIPPEESANPFLRLYFPFSLAGMARVFRFFANPVASFAFAALLFWSENRTVVNFVNEYFPTTAIATGVIRIKHRQFSGAIALMTL